MTKQNTSGLTASMILILRWFLYNGQTVVENYRKRFSLNTANDSLPLFDCQGLLILMVKRDGKVNIEIVLKSINKHISVPLGAGKLYWTATVKNKLYAALIEYVGTNTCRQAAADFANEFQDIVASQGLLSPSGLKRSWLDDLLGKQTSHLISNPCRLFQLQLHVTKLPFQQYKLTWDMWLSANRFGRTGDCLSKAMYDKDTSEVLQVKQSARGIPKDVTKLVKDHVILLMKLK